MTGIKLTIFNKRETTFRTKSPYKVILPSDKSLIFSRPCRTKIGLFYSVLLNKYNV